MHIQLAVCVRSSRKMNVNCTLRPQPEVQAAVARLFQNFVWRFVSPTTYCSFFFFGGGGVRGFVVTFFFLFNVKFPLSLLIPFFVRSRSTSERWCGTLFQPLPQFQHITFIFSYHEFEQPFERSVVVFSARSSVKRESNMYALPASGENSNVQRLYNKQPVGSREVAA